MTAVRPLPAAVGNLALLEQGAAVLARLDPATYTAARPGWSPVGAQVRHVLDHYLALLDGLAERRVNYDARRRDPRIELDPRAALDLMERIGADLAGLDEAEGDLALDVHGDSGGGDGLDWRRSTLGRELQFLASHTVHHWALVRLLLEGHGVRTSADFGLAPSTRAHLAGSR